MLIFWLALRNILLHKTKTLIIGLLLVVAMVVMIFGNSLMDTAKQASEQAWIRCYAGDFMIRPIYQQGEHTILGFTFGDAPEKIKAVQPWPAILQLAEANPNVIALSPVVQVWSRFSFAENRYSGGSVMGIDPTVYKQVFPDSMELLEGRFLEPGERGIVITTNVISQVRSVLGLTVNIGDLVNCSSVSDDGFAVAELPLVGIFRYRTDNRMLQMSAFTDIASARHLASFGEDSDSTLSIKAGEDAVSQTLAEGGSLDDLFADPGQIVDNQRSPLSASSVPMPALPVRTQKPVPDYKTGDFKYALGRFAPGTDATAQIAVLNAGVKVLNPNLEVVSWYGASGGFVHMTETVRIIFMVLVVILCMVIVFVITNALLISIAERTVEIGTMRALGGSAAFVRKLFITESMVLSLGFGAVGIIVALLVIHLVGQSGIRIDDGFNAAMFGSSRLNPVVSLASVVMSLVVLVGVGLCSSLYPVSVALKLRPVEALGR